MESIRIMALLGLLNFFYQITEHLIKLKKKGISASKQKKVINSFIRSIVVIALFLLFMSEMASHTSFYSLSVLPGFLSQTLHSSIYIALVGVITLIIAVVVLNLTLAVCNANLWPCYQLKKTEQLITRGIFAYTRNPFFISIDLLLISISLIYSSPFFISFTVLSLVGFHLCILKEERILSLSFGEKYQEYSKSVKRYF